MIKAVRLEASCSFMALIPVTLDYYPISKTNWISAFLSALIPYLNALYFSVFGSYSLCCPSWHSSPCSLNSHFHCQHIILCFLNLFHSGVLECNRTESHIQVSHSLHLHRLESQALLVMVLVMVNTLLYNHTSP